MKIDKYFMYVIALLSIVALKLNAKSRMPDTYVTKCANEIDLKLKELKSADNWIRVVDSKPNHKTYRSPTKVVGEWVEVIAGDEPAVHFVTPNGIKEFVWDAKTCNMVISTLFGKDKKYINVAGPIYTDLDIKKAIAKKECTVVYAYSPLMSYSIQFIDDMADSAQKLGCSFVPVLDPNADIKEVKKVFANKKNFKVQKAASVEILMRQMLHHYPASMVIHNGMITDPFIFGAMSKEDYGMQISKRMLQAQAIGVAK